MKTIQVFTVLPMVGQGIKKSFAPSVRVEKSDVKTPTQAREIIRKRYKHLKNAVLLVYKGGYQPTLERTLKSRALKYNVFKGGKSVMFKVRKND